MTGDAWVAGVDGCPFGWIVVLRPLDAPEQALARLVPSFEDVLALEPAARIICVDMPIGLPAIKGTGGRVADTEARAVLGRRKASVFSVPSRDAVMQNDYRSACSAAQATSSPPRKVSKQTFNIFPKIREVDTLMTPELQSRVHEAHPEVAFWALNGERPLDHPKRSKPGLELRRDLLAGVGFPTSLFEGRSAFRASDVGLDDLLDAAVCSWTAARIATGTGRRFPDNPSLDAKGLRMEIWG